MQITYPQHEIDRFNREYEAEQMDIKRLEFVRKTCSVFSEKNEAGQIADGREFMNYIGKGVR